MTNHETVHGLAYFIFLIALLLTIYFRDKARNLPKATGKEIRSIYRKAWVESVLKGGDNAQFIQTMRNNISISTALLGATIVSFGLILNAGIVKENGDIFGTIRILSVIALLGYALFMLLLEIRTLTYIPIVSHVPESFIKKYEKTDKASYIAKLLHESFDNFSNAIRSLFYIAPLLIWFYNVHLFIVATMVISYAMYHEDFGTKSGIVLF